MRWERPRLAVGTEFSQTWPQHYRQRHCAEASHCVNHSGSREIDVAMSQVHRVAQLRQPTAAPDPAAEDGIENRADEHLTQQKSAKGNTLANGTHDDISSGFHEH